MLNATSKPSPARTQQPRLSHAEHLASPGPHHRPANTTPSLAGAPGAAEGPWGVPITQLVGSAAYPHPAHVAQLVLVSHGVFQDLENDDENKQAAPAVGRAPGQGGSYWEQEPR